MHTPGLIKRLKEATILLEAYDLAEEDPSGLLRLAAVKVAEVNRSLETHLKPLKETSCRPRNLPESHQSVK